MQDHKIWLAYKDALEKIQSEKETLFSEINKLAEKSNALTKKVGVLKDEKFKLETENKISREKSIEAIKQDKYDFLNNLETREKKLYNSELKFKEENISFLIEKNKVENKSLDLLKRENNLLKKEKNISNREDFIKVENEKIFSEKNKIIFDKKISKKNLKKSKEILKKSEKKISNEEWKINSLKEEYLHKLEILEKQKKFFEKKDNEIKNEKLLIKSEWSQIKNSKKLIQKTWMKMP